MAPLHQEVEAIILAGIKYYHVIKKKKSMIYAQNVALG